MLFKDPNFYIGLCWSGIFISILLHFFYFSKAHEAARILDSTPSTNVEYKEFWRENGPQGGYSETVDPTGTGHYYTLNYPFVPANNVPEEEMSDAVKRGMKEISDRAQALRHIKNWENNNIAIGALSAFILFWFWFART